MPIMTHRIRSRFTNIQASLLCTILLCTGHICAASTLPAIYTLRTTKARVRTGPGKIYPALWLLMARGLPVYVLDTFQMWYQIEDPLGTKGWIHKTLLSRTPSVYVSKNLPLVKNPSAQAPILAQVRKGAMLHVLGADARWFYVRWKHLRGYIPRHLCWRGLDKIYNKK